MRRLGIAAVGGVLSFLSFQPFNLWPLQIVGLVALFYSISGQGIGRTLFLGLIYGVSFYLPLLKWSGLYVGWLPWMALALLQTVFVLLFAAVTRLWKSSLAIASFWVLCEALASRFPWGGFGWGRVAYSQADAFYAVLVSLGGASLLSFFCAAIAAIIVHRTAKSLWVVGFVPLALMLTPQESGQSFEVAAVQGNVPRLGLDFNAQREAVLTNHLDATRKIPASSVDLIVWPENASDVDPYSVSSRISEVVDLVQTPVIVGGIVDSGSKQFNSSILWSPVTGPSTRYDKQELAPFGEFMPIRWAAERVVAEAKRVRDFTPGQVMVLHQVGPARVGPIICFEVLNDGIVRSAVEKGANLLIVQTNSATFGRSPESAQQLQMIRLRAREHNRAVVAASTTGISALIQPDGEVITRSETFTQAVLVGHLPLQQKRSVADHLGGWSELLLSSLWVVRRRR